MQDHNTPRCLSSQVDHTEYNKGHKQTENSNIKQKKEKIHPVWTLGHSKHKTTRLIQHKKYKNCSL